MGLFSKPKQRITISNEERSTLDGLAAALKARKLKDTKVSSVQQLDDQWQFVVSCKQAEALYYQEVLPLLYDSDETLSCEALLEFDDEIERVKKCPQELLVSFSLKSGYAFGDDAEHAFMQKLHGLITQTPQDKPAAVAYYIVSGASATMSIPCADPQAMERSVKNIFKAVKIEQFMISVADRDRA